MSAAIGFPTTHKENERRRITPETMAALVEAGVQCVAEGGYAECLGYSDEEMGGLGIAVASRAETLGCPFVCDLKAGDADYLGQLKEDQLVFGWLHAVQGRQTATALMESGCTAIAWEDIFARGRHVFWANNFLAGEAAIMHVSLLRGSLLRGMTAAVLGRGNVAQGAVAALNRAGVQVEFFGRAREADVRDHLGEFDLVVNAVLWDTARDDHIIYRANLSAMRRGAWIVDISCDQAGAIETSTPTTIEDPVYRVDGVVHYVVDHTPAILYRDASEAISAAVSPYLAALGQGAWRGLPELVRAVAIENHKAVDPRIVRAQRESQ